MYGFLFASDCCQKRLSRTEEIHCVNIVIIASNLAQRARALATLKGDRRSLKEMVNMPSDSKSQTNICKVDIVRQDKSCAKFSES
jgi:hypothetical protein